MMSVGYLTVLAIIGMVLLLAAAVRLGVDRARLAAAGVDGDRAGCATCLYPLGGWSSPVCPECEADVVAGGARIGPTTSRPMVRWGAGLIVVSVALPVFLPGTAWLLDARTQRMPVTLDCDSPTHRVVLEVESEWSRFPPIDRRRVAVGVLPGPQEGRPQGTTVTSDDPRLTVDDWAAIITEGAGVDPDDPGLAPAATALAGMVEAFLKDGPDAVKGATGRAQYLEPYDPVLTFSVGRRSEHAVWRPLLVLVVGFGAAMSVAAWGARWAAARVPAGSRPVEASEWATGTASAAPATAGISPPHSA